MDRFYRDIYSVFGPNDVVMINDDTLANFIHLMFNLPHILCHAIFYDYHTLHKCELDAYQYESIMKPLYKVKGSVLDQRISLFNDFDQNHDGYICIDELTVQFTLYKKKIRKYFPLGTRYTVKNIINTFDLNKDNKLSFLDFNHCLNDVAMNNFG